MLRMLRIRRWRYGFFDDIALDKRSHLETHNIFETNILAGFNPALKHRGLLARLASELRRTLVEREEPGCWGSLKSDNDNNGDNDSDNDNDGGNKDRIDPFERRIEHCKGISAELLGVLERYAEKAKGLITPQQRRRRRRLRSRRGRGTQ
ncbi:hypothetical protein EV182_002570 [Spiromyces aspiralis]|uniref:Uncharacterized protein n=1 Tax=Spiromyces aspiralis TaxID=68401 RepID=A0ACC1HV29_9FUNG|nr:hypothetical protein EV182_002570 [Spiromyces aspiralis]